MILELLKNHPIVESINQLNGKVANLSIEQEALLLANTNQDKPIIIVKPNLFLAQKLYNQLYIYLKEEVLLFQSDESLRFESIASSPEMVASMIENLFTLQTRKIKIIVTHLQAYLRYLPNPQTFQNASKRIKINQEYTKKDFELHLIQSGYKKVNRVDRPLCFASRGGVIDIFSINYDYPIRIEFFDTEIESIRFFDIATQRTIKKIDEVNLIPATSILLSETELNTIKNNIPQEINDDLVHQIAFDLDLLAQYDNDLRLYRYFSLLDKKYHLNDYIDAYTIYSSIEELNYANERFELDTQEFTYELLQLNQTLPDLQYYFDFYHFKPDFYFNQFNQDAIEIDIQSIPSTNYNKEIIFEEMVHRSLTHSVYLCVNKHQKELVELRIKENHIKHNLNIIILPITQGFIYNNIYVYSAKEIFQEKVTTIRSNNKFKNAKILNAYQDLNINDYVVHEKHGVGRYLGLTTKLVNNIHKDYLHIEYENNTKLFIPVDQFQLVRKFLSKDAISVKLSTIGSKKWSVEKEKIQKGIEELAQQLVELYTLRSEKQGFEYAKDDLLQQMFEDDFEYELTQDQKRCVEEIKTEMQSSSIMDRLLCGDVGFGKTEVAAIAAFKAVNNGKQVAYLCPTTILSNQHYKTFKKRFRNFPVRIELLNRFISKKQATQIIQDAKDGKVDILIGTHRILSKDVEFKNLGFLIIDEEQRFGVVQKEKIKQLKNNLDVLSLSATPIPRTLQMSLVGIRTLSQLDTPPKNRYSVQTYILESNPKIIKDIIEKEIARNGQVFYLYNDTTKIYSIAQELEATIPGIKVGVGHGQMNKNDLEDVMINFIENKFNVLVCTTIIETGIDIPNANTIIIDQADKFGLAQLYQIKGRVGRGDRVAYAYLMYDQGKVLTQEASERLHAIKEFTQLGSGYKIAMRDLSIRGAGSLLGGKQAGFIDTVGMDMYVDMLNEAIKSKKGITEELKELPSTTINVDAYIPESFLDDDMEKLQIYTRLAKVTTFAEYNELLSDIHDNFGRLPKMVQLLFEKKRFDLIANHPFINSYNETASHLSVTFSIDYSHQVHGEKIFELTNEFSKEIQIKYQNKQISISMMKIKDYLPHFIDIISSCINLIN